VTRRTSPTAVLDRLLHDERLQRQIRISGTRARGAYLRGRRLPAHKAAQDQRLFNQVREATAALNAALRRALGEPEPAPQPRRGRRLMALAVIAATFALVRSMHQAQQAAARSPASLRT